MRKEREMNSPFLSALTVVRIHFQRLQEKILGISGKQICAGGHTHQESTSHWKEGIGYVG
jgi:hypothetical protein